jgi:hypothetical protein
MRHELVHRTNSAAKCNCRGKHQTRDNNRAWRKDDAQLTLIITMPAFGDSTIPMLISKNKSVNKVSLAAQQLFEGHDCTIRTAEKLSSQKYSILTGYKLCFFWGCPISVKGPSTRAWWCWFSRTTPLKSLLGSLPMLSLRDCRSFDLCHIPRILRNPLTCVFSVCFRLSITKRENRKPWKERQGKYIVPCLHSISYHYADGPLEFRKSWISVWPREHEKSSPDCSEQSFGLNRCSRRWNRRLIPLPRPYKKGSWSEGCRPQTHANS